MPNSTKVKLAAVQAAPVTLDLDATVEKTCSIIREAAANGANVIGFPEAFIPTYPWWLFNHAFGKQVEFFTRLYENAVEIPSPAVQKLSACARECKMYVCVSVTEKDGGSLYLTQLWFNPDGDLIGKHRKMKPTGPERTVWGDGDGSMMPVMQTEYGRLGGLQCWEHYIPMNIAAMGSQNEQIHVSSWPIGMPDPTHPFSDQQCQNGSLYYAVSNACFVICSSQIWTPEMEDVLCETPEQALMEYGHGCTCIVSPGGYKIAELPRDVEGICYADVDLADIVPVRHLIDTAGHYSTPASLQMWFDARPHKAVHTIGSTDQEPLPYEVIQYPDFQED